MTDVPEKFRERLLKAVNESDLNPTQISRLSGVKVHVVRDLLRGKSLTTSYENAAALADALRIPGLADEQSAYVIENKNNDLRDIRAGMAISEKEMAELLKMPIGDYLMIEDPEQYPELPRHISMQIDRLIQKHTAPTVAASAATMTAGEVDLRLEGKTVTIVGRVDSQSIRSLITKLEALATVISD